MSGGVGLACDELSNIPREPKDDVAAAKRSGKRIGGFLSFRQMNSLALIVILSASGMVYAQDFAFVVLSIFYTFFLSRFAFPRLAGEEAPVFDPEKSRFLRAYVSVGAAIGLLLPIAYIGEGVYEGDKEGVRAAIPHVFLLASQVFMEGVAFSAGFSTPMRAFVPVSYNAVRMGSLLTWLADEFSKVHREFGGNPRRVVVGRALAIANVAFWGFNLLGFLLPVYLPRAFKIYYSDSKLD